MRINKDILDKINEYPLDRVCEWDETLYSWWVKFRNPEDALIVQEFIEKIPGWWVVNFDKELCISHNDCKSPSVKRAISKMRIRRSREEQLKTQSAKYCF